MNSRVFDLEPDRCPAAAAAGVPARAIRSGPLTGVARRGSVLLCALASIASPDARAASDPESTAIETTLPAPIAAAFKRAQVPLADLAIVVRDVESTRPSLAWNATEARNPASVFKLITDYAALDLLGPAFTWRTPVWIQGRIERGVLDGSIAIRGSGDPSFTADRVRGLLRRLRGYGIREIRGDIVLDRSLFAAPAADPGDFDGQALRPQNVQADALLFAWRSVIRRFTPDPEAEVARIESEPDLEGGAQSGVPLAAGPCGDWHAALQAAIADPERARFAGRYPASCGERIWATADPDPAGFDERLLRAMWRELGGGLSGRVVEGRAPTQKPPSFELESAPLAEIVRDLTKASNNVMAQQLFLTLGLAAPAGVDPARADRLAPDPAAVGARAARAPSSRPKNRASDAGSSSARAEPGTPAAARRVLRGWLESRLGAQATGIVVDNGSGLSRATRISAAAIAELLAQAWHDPLMPELISAMPIAGIDGTLHARHGAAGRAHLKSGSLRDVASVAGIVDGRDGRRRIVVVIVSGPALAGARDAIDSLLDWVADEDGPGAARAGPQSTPGR